MKKLILINNNLKTTIIKILCKIKIKKILLKNNKLKMTKIK